MSQAVSCSHLATQPSALLLSDRLLRLAEDASHAGCQITAEHLLALAHTVFDDADELTAPPNGARVMS